MNQNDYNKLLGKLEGLYNAHALPWKITGNSDCLITLQQRIKQLESQLSGITVHDEVAELKARATHKELIFPAICKERAFQNKKALEKGWTTEKSIMEFIVIMEGEINEVKQAYRKGTMAEQLCELLQVISVGVACLEQHGVCTREQLEALKSLEGK